MKEKREFNWMILFWICISIILLWIVAKKVGLFNTSLIVQLIPYITGVFAILAIVKEFGKLVNKLDNVVSDVSEVKIDVKTIRTELHSLDKRVAVLESRI